MDLGRCPEPSGSSKMVGDPPITSYSRMAAALSESAMNARAQSGNASAGCPDGTSTSGSPWTYELG
ncbi:hypothetical protein ACFWP7_02290 [Streptomyces sp. NPDC058470]|uniref:hypothetical protein n=1 Tax=Streptomyces sp. NPDC058470 TaxID=3346515 RepID=UPI003663B8D4